MEELNLPSGRSAKVFTFGDNTAVGDNIKGDNARQDNDNYNDSDNCNDNNLPLVFFHSAGGVDENDPFLNQLAASFKIYAPVAPGFSDLEELDDLVSVSDVALHYDDILEALNIAEFHLAGHSFGGMFAAEYAAHYPKKVKTLSLIAPVGLWNDDYPVLDIFATPPLELGQYLFGDPDSELAQAFSSLASDISGNEEEIVESIIQTVQGLVTAGKYMMPIPDRGLNRRLYRVIAPTLLIWGERDQIVSANYAKDFAKLLRDSKELIVKGGGHMITLEFTDKLVEAITKHAK